MSASNDPHPTLVTSPSLTLQQVNAVEHRASHLALSSGAGCGKTTVLSQRLIADYR